jgi:hypothetical protein
MAPSPSGKGDVDGWSTKNKPFIGEGPLSDDLDTPWCGRGDLNPHDLHRWNLNPVRLPIPPRPPLQLPERLFRPVRDRFLAQRRSAIQTGR